MVIIGTLEDILDTLLRNREVGISNTINDLPDIYFSINDYKPHTRFKGVFPFGDAVVEGVKQLSMDYLPLNTTTDIITNIITFYENSVQPLIHKRLNKSKNANKPQILYAKFSYLPEHGAINLGKKFVFFESVFCKILGIKESSV